MKKESRNLAFGVLIGFFTSLVADLIVDFRTQILPLVHDNFVMVSVLAILTVVTVTILLKKEKA